MLVLAVSVIAAVGSCHGAARTGAVGRVVLESVIVVVEGAAFVVGVTVALHGVELRFYGLVLEFEVCEFLEEAGVGFLQLGEFLLAVGDRALDEHLRVLRLSLHG